MSNQSTIESIAARLREAEASRQPIAPVRGEVAANDAALAYAVQRHNVELRCAQGERIVGRKIGLTSRVVQQRLEVDEPDFGTLFASMALGDNEEISLKSLIQPKIEGEIALVLGRDLTSVKHTFVDLIEATAYALAAIEIVDSRVQNWDIRLVDTVSDNGSSARFVLGSRPVPLREINLTGCAMTLTRSGEELSRRGEAACYGNPLNTLAWLADRMVRLGTPLRAGDLLLTGALGPLVPVTQKGVYVVQIEGIGSVRANFVE